MYFIQYNKRIFLINLAKLKSKYSIEEMKAIQLVIDKLQYKPLKFGDFDAHQLKYRCKFGFLFDCHPLYKINPKIDLVLLYSYDKHNLYLHNIGTHKEVFKEFNH